VPDDWLAKFDFIKAKGDDIKGLRQVYAAMTHYMVSAGGRERETTVLLSASVLFSVSL